MGRRSEASADQQTEIDTRAAYASFLEQGQT
jgi:hypothetical protein